MQIGDYTRSSKLFVHSAHPDDRAAMARLPSTRPESESREEKVLRFVRILDHVETFFPKTWEANIAPVRLENQRQMDVFDAINFRDKRKAYTEPDHSRALKLFVSVPNKLFFNDNTIGDVFCLLFLLLMHAKTAHMIKHGTLIRLTTIYLSFTKQQCVSDAINGWHFRLII